MFAASESIHIRHQNPGEGAENKEGNFFKKPQLEGGDLLFLHTRHDTNHAKRNRGRGSVKKSFSYNFRQIRTPRAVVGKEV